MATSRTTQDHGEIKRWAEERGGKPSHVKSTGSSDHTGILRIDFPGYSGAESLEEISWDDFFAKFDAQGLALVYQDESDGGEQSNFNKLVKAEPAPRKKAAAARKAPPKKAAAKKAIAKKAPLKKTAAKKTAVKKKAVKNTVKKAPPKKAVKKAVKKAAKKSAGRRR